MSFNHYYCQQDSFHPNSGQRQHGNTGTSSSSSSRWIPPTKVRQEQELCNPPADAKYRNDDGYIMQHENIENNNCRQSEVERRIDWFGGDDGGKNNLERGTCRQGGGKIVWQRRHGSNDTRHQRNLLHRQPQHKKIITPTEGATQPLSKMGVNSNSGNPIIISNDDAPKLNPSIPTEARRIQQRLRQVLFGKNTTGYEEYIKRVPKNKRKHRSLECPMTPDHTADIPAKRWQGLLNAWRRGLHQYDPTDLHLQQSSSQTTITLAPRLCFTKDDIQAEEIAQAKASGLQVAFGSMNVGEEAKLFSMKVSSEEDEGELLLSTTNKNSIVGGDNDTMSSVHKGMNDETPIFDEEEAYQRAMMMGGEEETGFLDEFNSDSDDDIL